MVPGTAPAVVGGSSPPWKQIYDLAVADGWTGLYDPSNPNTRTLRNSGGTDYVTDLADALGNLTALSQSTAANQPSLGAGQLGELDGMLFDGSNDSLSTSAFSSALSQPNFIASVFRDTLGTSSATSRFIHGGIAGSSNQHNFWENTAQFHMRAGTSAGPYDSISTNNRVAGLLFNGASSSMIIDNTTHATSAGTASVTGLRVGINAAGSGDYWTGYIGAVVIFDGSPSTAVRDRMLELLRELAGI